MHNKSDDLLSHREEISEIMKIEIVSRYYFQKGKVESSLVTDPEVKQAINLIEEKSQYSTILSGTSKASSKLN
jgi:carboxyl-terminal processing protease